MESTNKNKESASSSTSADAPSSSRSSKRNKERDSSKAKEKSRRARDHPATTPGAVPSSSNRTERKKERSSGGGKRTSSASADKSDGRKTRSSSSAASKPGAVSSTGRDRSKKGSSRSSKSSHRPSSSKASSGSSKTRSSRPNEEKQYHLAANAPDRGTSVAHSATKMESGIVAEAVDDTEMQTTTNALREKNRENEALRQELQRTREQQASQSRSRGKPFWGKVCLGSLILIGAIIGAVIAFSGGGGGDEPATPAILNPTNDPTSDPTEQTTSEPTVQANTTIVPTNSPTVGPDGQTVFDPPSASACSKIAEGLPVDGQEDMSMQPMGIKMDINLVVDLKSDLWLPELTQNIQQLVMPPIVGCGNTTLDVFTIGNAQVVEPANINALARRARNLQTNGSPGYTVEFLVNLFMKKDVASYNLNDLKQLVEGIFQDSRDLLVKAQDENAKAIKDIGSVTSVPVTPSPSLQPSSNLLVITNSPTPSPSLQPTMALTSGATASPTKLSTPSPTVAPASGSTLAPTSAPSLEPTLSPTSGPTLAPVPGATPPPSPLPTPGPTTPPSPLPTPGPTITPTLDPSDSPSQGPSPTPSLQPSVAPTTKCMRIEATLSRFAPFDGNKGLARDWLCLNDTWEPPIDPADETSLWEERFALGVFYYATTGDGWVNNDGWLTSADVCSWHGINGCNGDGSVTKINLSQLYVSYGLVGDFPDEMRALSNLEHIVFHFNRYLSGTIPSFLTSLTKLTELGIADTGRTGSIPSELWTLTKLKNLNLNGNYLTGTIPSGIGALTELLYLNLDYNDYEFASMTQLTFLHFVENFVGGTVPPLPSSLIYCGLAKEAPAGQHYRDRKTEGNCFTDTTNAGSCDLSANQCQLEATLSRFAPFDGNKGLALDWLKSDTWEPPSSATDEISQSLWEERFALAVFYYATTGDGWVNNDGWLTSADVCSWHGIDGCNGDGSVTKINLSSGSTTGLVGDFPDEMRALASLEHMDFTHSRYLSGAFPSFLTALTKLTFLRLSDTGRIGTIPSELWTMTQMKHLSIWGNYLTGTIPSGISAIAELDYAAFSYNDLTGTLPDEFESMTRLTALHIHENYLSGTIPPLPSLTECKLAREEGTSAHFIVRKTEGNCFTDTSNAPGVCDLSKNCP